MQDAIGTTQTSTTDRKMHKQHPIQRGRTIHADVTCVAGTRRIRARAGHLMRPTGPGEMPPDRYEWQCKASMKTAGDEIAPSATASVTFVMDRPTVADDLIRHVTFDVIDRGRLAGRGMVTGWEDEPFLRFLLRRLNCDRLLLQERIGMWVARRMPRVRDRTRGFWSWRYETKNEIRILLGLDEGPQALMLGGTCEDSGESFWTSDPDIDSLEEQLRIHHRAERECRESYLGYAEDGVIAATREEIEARGVGVSIWIGAWHIGRIGRRDTWRHVQRPPDVKVDLSGDDWTDGDFRRVAIALHDALEPLLAEDTERQSASGRRLMRHLGFAEKTGNRATRTIVR